MREVGGQLILNMYLIVCKQFQRSNWSERSAASGSQTMGQARAHKMDLSELGRVLILPVFSK